MYSAVKVGGRKMYTLARQGKEIRLPSRRITVYSIEILEADGAHNACLLRIECSKGTYIRSLCGDMAKEMGTLGYVSFLLRTRACGADISQALTLDEIEERAQAADFGFLTSMDEALRGFEKCTLEDYLFPILTTGTPIDLTRVKNADRIARCQDMRVYCKNRFIGMGRAEENTLKINTMVYIGETDS